MHNEARLNHLALAAILAISTPLAWAAPLHGAFTASQACPAYVSKNHPDRHDGLRLKPGQTYQALEANRPEGADWYRLRVPGATPEQRWVAVSCGQLVGTGPAPTPAPAPSGRAACSSPGRADSYVLAMSWEPAFCETHRDKKECRETDPNAYQAGHFTLHGLWPNRRECGTSYGFCGAVHGERKNFCDYPAMDLGPAVRTELAQVMPGEESCLERHEWYKHGTCQTRWTADQYFAMAVSLTRQFNDAGMAALMAGQVGGEIATADFLAQVDKGLGERASRRVELDCDRRHRLTEVRLGLPADLRPDESLKDLVARAAERPGRGGACRRRFRVDAIGVGN
jgi:ribonuclease T2